MNIKSIRFGIIALITFVILFLMNYIGNQEQDKLQNALMVATGGVIGLTIGMWFVHRNNKDNTPQDFD